MTTTTPRLTSLSHGGGCGCKIAPDVLTELVKGTFPLGQFPDLLVGNQDADDAAVYRLNDEQALIATTDFFMPIVDDPYDFGRIAAANALSDVYAMGGKPIMALALVGMPLKQLDTATINTILSGGASICETAGIPVAGGHSIDSVEPIYGLAAMGLVHPNLVKRNTAAKDGDVLILSKALGVGILSAALKKDQLSDASYQALIHSTTQLNTAGSELAKLPGVHAMTDVTGFSLLGHTLELCRGAHLEATLQFGQLPWLADTLELAASGIKTGASGRNWAACAEHASIDGQLDPIAQTLVTDPQTSGGLLVACQADAADEVLALLQQHGADQATVVGQLNTGQPHVHLQ